jgi:hypothetical protein
VETQPSSAVVGQQLLYRVRIVRREDVEEVEWARQPSFPGFRVEWLPGRAEDTEMHYRGVGFAAREEHRALFPTRAGLHQIPSAALRCTLARRGPHPPESALVEVPATQIRVMMPPERDRPADFSGVVGRVLVQTQVEPKSLHLGGSIRISVLVRGPGNIWDADAPFGGEMALGSAELFRQRPSLDFELGERLQVRRFHRFEAVPREAGELRIPAVRIPYYDPDTGRYAAARSQPVSVEVKPRLPTAGDAPLAGDRLERTGGRAGAGQPQPESLSPSPGWWAGALTVLLAAGSAVWGIRRRRRPWREVELALAQAERAASQGDPLAEAEALSRALRSTLAMRAPGLEALESKEIRERAGRDGRLLELATQLEALDWIRFSSEMGRPDRAGVRAAVAALRRD